MAKSIMVQGTTSNAGKSFLAAALCRIFRQDDRSKSHPEFFVFKPLFFSFFHKEIVPLHKFSFYAVTAVTIWFE